MNIVSATSAAETAAASAQASPDAVLVLSVTGPRGEGGGLHYVKPPGAWVGRSAACDIVLNDPDRFVSGRHARIDYLNGLFWLSDHSVNGTFLNNDDAPLARGDSRPLRPGDRFRAGLFEVRVGTGDSVTLDGLLPDLVSGGAALDADPGSRGGEPPGREPSGLALPRFDDTTRPAGPNRLNITIADLLSPVDSPVVGVAASQPDATGDATGGGVPKMTGLPPPPPPADAATTLPVTSRPADGAAGALVAFWRGLGVLPTQIDPAELSNVMSELGMALRETAEQMGILLRTISPVGSAVTNVLADGHIGLRRHLQTPSVSRQSLDIVVRDAFVLLATREDAYVSAVSSGVRQALQSISASSIEERFSSTLRSSFPAGRRAELWRMISCLENELIDLAEAQFHREVSAQMSSRVRTIRTYEGNGNGF